MTKRFVVSLAHLGNVKQKKDDSLKSYINHFNEMSNFVTWSPNAGVLAHLTNGVLPETPFWDELQQKECRSVSELYKKASKFPKLEDSKEALRKAEGAAANKKNDPREVPDNSKSKDKRRREDKRAKMKQKSGPVENKGLLPKFTNYHSLIAPLDHIYAVTDRGLYRSPEPTKGDRARRDVKRNCAFHKDIGHNTNTCVALKDEIERLIRAGHFKEFIDEPHAMNREERPRQQSPEKV